MATFPTSLNISPESRITPDRGIKTYMTEGGGVRGRVQYAAAVYELALVFEDLNDTERQLIDDHFDPDPVGDHQVTVRGVTYNVTYLGQPTDIEYHGIYRTVSVNFLGTKA